EVGAELDGAIGHRRCGRAFPPDVQQDTPIRHMDEEGAPMRAGYRTFFPKLLRALAIAGTVLVTGCAGVHTTQSGAVGVQRTQYMASIVPEQELQQAAGQGYSELIQQAEAQGALDRNAAEVSRVREISQRLIAQVDTFRPDAAGWDW